jgi:hypothetical protein
VTCAREQARERYSPICMFTFAEVIWGGLSGLHTWPSRQQHRDEQAPWAHSRHCPDKIGAARPAEKSPASTSPAYRHNSWIVDMHAVVICGGVGFWFDIPRRNSIDGRVRFVPNSTRPNQLFLSGVQIQHDATARSQIHWITLGCFLLDWLRSVPWLLSLSHDKFSQPTHTHP